MKCGTVICYRCDSDSLADVSFNEFEARLHDALLERWPGATVNISLDAGRTWGVVDDETEIPDGEIQQIANEVFSQIC